jgi:hypothetical protein
MALDRMRSVRHTKQPFFVRPMSEFRRSLIGGNWKCNGEKDESPLFPLTVSHLSFFLGTVAEVNQMIDFLNSVEVPASSEVRDDILFIKIIFFRLSWRLHQSI